MMFLLNEVVIYSFILLFKFVISGRDITTFNQIAVDADSTNFFKIYVEDNSAKFG